MVKTTLSAQALYGVCKTLEEKEVMEMSRTKGIHGDRLYSGTKTFDGKKFELVMWFEKKSEAQEQADKERRRGYNARVVKEKVSNLPARWLVYRR